MASVFDSLFGPLSKDYCNVFLLFSVLALIVLVTTIIAALTLIFSKKGKLEWYVGLIYGVFVSALQYFMFRLLYNMCRK